LRPTVVLFNCTVPASGVRCRLRLAMPSFLPGTCRVAAPSSLFHRDGRTTASGQPDSATSTQTIDGCILGALGKPRKPVKDFRLAGELRTQALGTRVAVVTFDTCVPAFQTRPGRPTHSIQPAEHWAAQTHRLMLMIGGNRQPFGSSEGEPAWPGGRNVYNSFALRQMLPEDEGSD